eukprot:TRINITY_DN621_c0_g1_i1.p1 TRINITY_DN621_c0_g1~~TRINITY_DN621_c0_g1_i1.p1  ORF type:complete len:118 (-),score=32.63 TRINITY_DN621_c0_g1_i1:72-425(-)
MWIDPGNVSVRYYVTPEGSMKTKSIDEIVYIFETSPSTTPITSPSKMDFNIHAPEFTPGSFSPEKKDDIVLPKISAPEFEDDRLGYLVNYSPRVNYQNIGNYSARNHFGEMSMNIGY